MSEINSARRSRGRRSSGFPGPSQPPWRVYRRLKAGLLAATALAALSGCGSAPLASHTGVTTPLTPPRYPDFSNPAPITATAQQLSRRLQNYIEAWMSGKAAARIPVSLLPDGTPPDLRSLTLERPSQVSPAAQWGIRLAAPVNPQNDPGLYQDPHATYLVLPGMFMPFGTKVLIHGQFPHARFFGIQTSPPFDPYTYYQGIGSGAVGVAEVPLVDADIRPDPGSSNPFAAGADRSTTRRSYTVTLTMAAGNAERLDPVLGNPYQREAGNTRAGSGIEYGGPWACDPAYRPLGKGNGCFVPGSVWLRYYLPDSSAGALAGVPLPKVTYQLPDGRQFFIAVDMNAFTSSLNKSGPVPQQTAKRNIPASQGPAVGWHKEDGVLRELFQSLTAPRFRAQSGPASAAYVRAEDKGVNSHGQNLPGIGGLTSAATENNYDSYLDRTLTLPAGDVAVITGTLPTTPRTLGGEPAMETGQARYWSITAYAAPTFDQLTGHGIAGQAISSLADENITTDRHGRYILAYSRPDDRPANASPANGVTWTSWGPTATASFTIRWLTVGPQWSFCRSPIQHNLGWSADRSSSNYNPALLGENNEQGFLGGYQPIIRIMTKAQFQTLGGGHINPASIPSWNRQLGTRPLLGPPPAPGPTSCPG